MPGVKAVCVAMGVLSLGLLAVAAAMAWFAATLPEQQSVERGAGRFAARVQSARSCEMLKAVCTDIASGYDVQHATMTRLNRLTDALLKRIAWFAAGWAIATATAFFYIFHAVRRRQARQAGTS